MRQKARSVAGLNSAHHADTSAYQQRAIMSSTKSESAWVRDIEAPLGLPHPRM